MSTEISLKTACSLGLILLSLAGCSRSSQTTDNAPLDVRGELISSAASSTNAPAVPGAPVAAIASNALPVAVPVAVAAPATVGQKADAFAPVSFDKLASYEFITPDETVTTNGIVSAATKVIDPFPLTIRALNQTRVALKGFMLPLKVESGLVTEMLIMRDQSMCCYGKVPKITEWVSVKMGQKGVKAIIDQPVTLFGRLHVGEIRENGYLVGIYRMDGEGMTESE
jgi:hypothetical protein